MILCIWVRIWATALLCEIWFAKSKNCWPEGIFLFIMCFPNFWHSLSISALDHLRRFNFVVVSQSSSASSSRTRFPCFAFFPPSSSLHLFVSVIVDYLQPELLSRLHSFCSTHVYACAWHNRITEAVVCFALWSTEVIIRNCSACLCPRFRKHTTAVGLWNYDASY